MKSQYLTLGFPRDRARAAGWEHGGGQKELMIKRIVIIFYVKQKQSIILKVYYKFYSLKFEQ